MLRLVSLAVLVAVCASEQCKVGAKRVVQDVFVYECKQHPLGFSYETFTGCQAENRNSKLVFLQPGGTVLLKSKTNLIGFAARCQSNGMSHSFFVDSCYIYDVVSQTLKVVPRNQSIVAAPYAADEMVLLDCFDCTKGGGICMNYRTYNPDEKPAETTSSSTTTTTTTTTTTSTTTTTTLGTTTEPLKCAGGDTTTVTAVATVDPETQAENKDGDGDINAKLIEPVTKSNSGNKPEAKIVPETKDAVKTQEVPAKLE